VIWNKLSVVSYQLSVEERDGRLGFSLTTGN
jgi:hypothetical protein